MFRCRSRPFTVAHLTWWNITAMNKPTKLSALCNPRSIPTGIECVQTLTSTNMTAYRRTDASTPFGSSAPHTSSSSSSWVASGSSFSALSAFAFAALSILFATVECIKKSSMRQSMMVMQAKRSDQLGNASRNACGKQGLLRSASASPRICTIPTVKSTAVDPNVQASTAILKKGCF